MDEDHEADLAIDAALGPFYDLAGVVALLGTTEEAVGDLWLLGRLIGAKTSEGDLLFPSFQFGTGGATLQRVDEVLAVLRRTGLSDWGAALWFRGSDLHGGSSAWSLMQSGAVDEVLLEATHWAERWAH